MIDGSVQMAERGNRVGPPSLGGDLNGWLAVLDESPVGISISRRSDGVIVYANACFADMVGSERGRLPGMSARQLFASTKSRELLVAHLKGTRRDKPFVTELRRYDGAPLCVQTSIREAMLDGERMNFAWVQDIDENRQVRLELKKLSMAVEQAPVTVMITNAQGTIEYVNRAFTEVTGYAADEVIGQTPVILKSGRVDPVIYSDLWQAISAGRTWQGEFCNRRKDGGLYWELATVSPIRDEQGAITHFLAVKEDVTLRKEYENRLQHQANYDYLTGLPNRLLAMDRLRQAVAAVKRSRKVGVVMLVVLDDVAKLNNSLGYKGGDAALLAFSRRLSSIVRDADTVARIGGNEFLVIVGGVESPTMAEVTAHRIFDDCRKSYLIEGREVFLTARIGLTTFPYDSSDPAILLRNAYAAAGRTTDGVSNNFRFFTPRMDEEAQRRLRIESNLQYAIERDELAVYYQPIVEAGSRRVIGAEALLRWSHPELGAVPPDRFIPVAESSDLIIPLSNWVLKTACNDARRWRTLRTPFKLAVNFSPRQFKHLDLVENILSITEGADYPHCDLEIEVTERLLMMGGLSNAKILLDTMKGLDISISIDDFGTGYSSLSYLQNYRFDTLKIDRTFVKELDQSAAARTLTGAIVDMARALDMQVIAEGVETESQEARLMEMGCQFMQGYLFGRPMPAAAFDKLMVA